VPYIFYLKPATQGNFSKSDPKFYMIIFIS